jgi:VIT1/CCC1 family predicted Fe2+/Mn2+ transporter
MYLKIPHRQLLKGLSFGLTSAVISSLGMIVGLDTATSSKLAIVSALVIMAVADGLSDAMGVHLAEEADNRSTSKEIWLSTVFTFLGVCGFTLTFIFPVLLFSSPSNIIVSVIWGLGLLSLLSFHVAGQKKESPLKVILEHNLIAVAVIVISYYLGILLKVLLG